MYRIIHFVAPRLAHAQYGNTAGLRYALPRARASENPVRIIPSGVGTGGRRGLAPPLNFAMGAALALAYATTRTRALLSCQSS